MKNVFLCCCNSYITQVMHNDVIDHIQLDLNDLGIKGFAVVDEEVVNDFFKNLEYFDYSNDDSEDSTSFDCDYDCIFDVLAKIIYKLVGFEVEVSSMEDGLYIWDWHRYDIDEVMMMAA